MMELIRRIVHWWRIDRIRIGPTVGRLLALDVGDRFIYRARSFTVTDRVVTDREDGYEVHLRLGLEEEFSSIKVFHGKRDMITTATIHQAGEACPIFDDDLMPLHPSRECRVTIRR